MRAYSRFVKLMLPHGVIFAMGFVCMLIASVLEISPLALVIPVVDKIISGKEIIIPESASVHPIVLGLVEKVNIMPPGELLKVLIFALVASFSLKCLFDYLRAYLMCDISQRVIRDIKNNIYRKLLSLSMDFYSHNPTGQLMSRITHDAAVIRDAISTGIADTFMMPIKIVTCVVWLVLIKLNFGIPWKLILVPAVVFPIIVYPVVMIGKKLREISTQSQQKIADINNMLLETITGIKLVKSFNMEGYEDKRFAGHNQRYYRLNLKAIKRMKIISPGNGIGIYHMRVYNTLDGGTGYNKR